MRVIHSGIVEDLIEVVKVMGGLKRERNLGPTASATSARLQSSWLFGFHDEALRDRGVIRRHRAIGEKLRR
jgi:hypothetical protein